jgi:hypothetical protein
MRMPCFFTLPTQIEIFTNSAFEPPSHYGLLFAIIALDFRVRDRRLQVFYKISVVQEGVVMRVADFALLTEVQVVAAGTLISDSFDG